MILLDNPLAVMRGPEFLVLYGMVILVVLLACWMAARLNEAAEKGPPPQIPDQPDPYEIAYLRGGENEVVRLTIFNLLQRGLLEMIGSRDRIKRVSIASQLDALTAMERAVYDAIPISMNAKDIFHGSLPSKVRQHCRPYEHRLQEMNLLNDAQTLATRWLVGLAGAMVIFGLGAYKLFAALSSGHSNVFFLIGMGVGALIVLFFLLRASRLSRRGRAYLRDLQTAFERLKFDPETITRPGGVFDPNLLLMAGVFGVTALSGTAAYAGYSQMFSKGSGSGCGASCGSGSSDGGGGDGGGCGGGGCGGCGS